MREIHISIVAGEESGDLLGADLVRALRRISGWEIRLSGVGGNHLVAEGLTTLFDPSEIALMGVSAVVRRLPRLMRRIRQTADSIVTSAPDCLVIIDSPDFTHRVARRVRASAPEIPIIDYVCPSVWAWRPGRAAAMTAYIDHVLAILPFEPEVLERLGGPPSTFVGHRLAQDPEVFAAAEKQQQHRLPEPGEATKLLVLPGSRASEVSSLLGHFGETVSVLAERGNRLEILLPTVANVAERVRAGTAGWKVSPKITLVPEQKWRAFGDADVALAASGTVLLELALVGVPTVSTYVTDLPIRLARSMITTWSAALPNLIADRVIVPEFFDSNIVPRHLARTLERLGSDTNARAEQIDGFSEVVRRIKTSRPSGEIAAAVVADHIKKSGD